MPAAAGVDEALAGAGLGREAVERARLFGGGREGLAVDALDENPAAISAPLLAESPQVGGGDRAGSAGGGLVPQFVNSPCNC